MKMTTLFRLLAVPGCVLLLLQPGLAATAASKVAQLSCEGRSDPLGVDLARRQLRRLQQCKC